MRILVVEDDNGKLADIMRVVNEALPRAERKIARSLTSGLRRLSNDNVDLIVLDMTMPTFDVSHTEDGGRPQAFGGRELLDHMRWHGLLVPVVIVTQFDRFGEGQEVQTLEELDGELRSEFGDIYVGVVYYSVTTEGWKQELVRYLEAAERAGPRD